MCVHDSGVLADGARRGEETWVRGSPGESGVRGPGSGSREPGWDGRGCVWEERRGKVSEDRVSMEKGEGLGIRLKGRGFEDRVCDATSVGDGEVTWPRGGRD